MFFRNLLPFEIPIMEKFIHYKIYEIVSILYKDKHGYIPRIEAPYLFRYFLCFPSQAQVVEEILPAIEKLESTTDKSKDLLEIEALIKHLITTLKSNTYASYDKETLIEAFKAIDTERNGYLDLHTFYLFMKSYGVSFIKEQIKEMEQFLIENDNELLEPLGICRDDNTKEKHLPTTTRKFYYESYVRKVLSDDEKHYEMITEEFEVYYENYKETGKFPPPPVIEAGQSMPVEEVKVKVDAGGDNKEKERLKKKEKKSDEQIEKEALLQKEALEKETLEKEKDKEGDGDNNDGLEEEQIEKGLEEQKGLLNLHENNNEEI